MITTISYNDNAGQIFMYNGIIYRGIFASYLPIYQQLLDTNLFTVLWENKLLIPHTSIDKTHQLYNTLHQATQHRFALIIQPQHIPCISYPSEWSFSMLKQAALHTLHVQELALSKGFILKDAKATNIQFINLQSIFIDTLSFEPYEEGKAWTAYRQFCEHFLAPLALMAYQDIELQKLLQIYTDGVPLPLATKLLSWSKLLFGNIFQHLTLHSWLIQQSNNNKKVIKSQLHHKRFTKNFIHELTKSLIDSTNTITYQTHTNWSTYYHLDVSSEYLNHKKELVEKMLKKCRPNILWDLGANTGVFSLLAAEQNIKTFSFDTDHDCIETLFITNRNQNYSGNIAIIDLQNPTPNRGFALKQYSDWLQRYPKADLILALALIHHLRITHNIPLLQIAEFMSNLSKYLIIEFIPIEDEKVQRLINNKTTVYLDYHLEEFSKIFTKYFDIIDIQPINTTNRFLFLLCAKFS